MPLSELTTKMTRASPKRTCWFTSRQRSHCNQQRGKTYSRIKNASAPNLPYGACRNYHRSLPGHYLRHYTTNIRLNTTPSEADSANKRTRLQSDPSTVTKPAQAGATACKETPPKIGRNLVENKMQHMECLTDMLLLSRIPAQKRNGLVHLLHRQS